MLTANTPDGSWSGFMIALICLAPVLMFLLSFEFSMFMIQVKNTYFKKQKWFEKGLIVDLVVIALTIVVAGIVTGFGIQNSYTGDTLTIISMAIWWLTVLLGITYILIRILLTRNINAKYKLETSDLLSRPVSDIATFANVVNYKEVINNNNLPNSRWKYIVDTEYNNLITSFKSLMPPIEKSTVSKLLADCVIFHEKFVVSMLKKKRVYVTALFLNLIETIQPIYNAAN
ncbi:MAG: hypothetical protein HUJ52_00120 [Malacoplasma sp.]|nr:hypothetical protein [Malacoplasma sp.]